MKKLLFAATTALLLFVLAACGSSDEGKTKIKVGTSAAETQTWKLIAEKAKEQDIDVEVVTFNDYVQPNLALGNGDIDLNAFQTVVYFDNFKKEHNLDLAVVGTTNIWPMGIYSEKVKDVADIKDGDEIAIPNDPTNLGRALFLLQKAGLITLDPAFTGQGGVENIKENPKNLKITPLDSAQTARALGDVTASVVNSDMSIAANLNPSEDAIFREDAENKSYINIVAAQTKNKDNEAYKKLVDLYHSQEVQDFNKKEFKGAAVPVNEEPSYLDDYEQN